jgi:hypothetical protein
MPNDLVQVSDAGRISLSRKEAYFWGNEKSVVEVKGWVTCLARERGKIVPGSLRSEHNVWTNTGREFLAMLMTMASSGSANLRDDRIAYIGAGTGFQNEDASVAGLITPVAYSGTTFLAPIDHSLTEFPLRPTRTTVRYVRVFSESEITPLNTSPKLISEFGLFTNGHQNSFAVNSRDTSFGNAALQAPVAYKALSEPIEKTSGIELEIDWEIRY